jgi:hypothetical protein
MADQRICAIEGCSKPQKHREWCRAHYRRWYRYGDPIAGGAFKNQVKDFYFSVVLQCEADECLLWPFAKNRGGYPVANIKENPSSLIHRSVCHARHGPPPSPKLDAAHSCGNALCCNPKHLRWATRKANEDDKLIHGTLLQGEKRYNAKLTATDVLIIRNLDGYVPHHELANSYGVSRQTVSDAIAGRTWRWLKD